MKILLLTNFVESATAGVYVIYIDSLIGNWSGERDVTLHVQLVSDTCKVFSYEIWLKMIGEVQRY
jgi:hypothetical protein